MLKSKSTLNFVMLISAVLGLILVIGCGPSAEELKMSEILKLYSEAVGEYAAADETQKAQLKEKIESYRLKCSAVISELELNDKATPQVIKKLEEEYKEITKKFESLHS